MRNIFLFIRRYFYFLVFLFLQGYSFYLIGRYSKYHQAAIGNLTNQITGTLNARYARVANYFNLYRTNQQLVKANEQLLNQLRTNYQPLSYVDRTFIDSTGTDSTRHYVKYSFKGASVVSNSVSAENNFIVISGGSRQYFHTGMGVIDPLKGAVGIIVQTSEDFSIVMSLLHRDSHISGKLLKGGETGTLSWDGEPNILVLQNISKSANVRVGDTVITSGFSTAFPKGMYIGKVTSVAAEKSTSKYRVRIKTAADFYNLAYVYAINNADQEKVEALLKKAQKQ